MTFQTLLFDLDGTISNPFEGISKCVNHALAAHGFDPAPPERIRRMIGPPLTEIFEELTGALTDAKMLDLVNAYRERYATSGYAENVVYPGIADALAALAGRGYRLGICTSKRADYAAKIVEMFGLAHLFRFIDGGDIHVKKFMQIERLVSGGVDPRTAVMIGDRAIDVDAARINGIAAIGVCWGFGGLEELESAAPKYIVREPAELLGLFP